jgi:hypothetical protein
MRADSQAGVRKGEDGNRVGAWRVTGGQAQVESGG